jgi:hypothetical protein
MGNIRKLVPSGPGPAGLRVVATRKTLIIFEQPRWRKCGEK